jgi:lantibiotic modifying enzyme
MVLNKKQKHINKIKGILLFVFLVSVITGSSAQTLESISFQSKNQTLNTISFDFSVVSNLIFEINGILLRNAEIGPETIKWNQYTDLLTNDPDDYYYAGQRGMAGIGQSYYKLYNVTQNQTYYDILIKIGNYLETTLVEDGYSVKWKKAEDEAQYWTSYRYGNTGIIPFLLDLYKLSNNNKYLDLAERAGNWLIRNSLQNGTNSVYWLTVGDTGFTSTDYYYGVAGIIDNLLKIYSVSNNKTFLEYSIMGANWILKSKVTINETNRAGFIPWTTSDIPSFKDTVYSGQLNGISGIGIALLNLYKISKDSYWLNQSRQLGYWLQSIDFNDTGLFPDGGAPYLTGLNEGAPNILGLGSGSLGIADFYTQLFLEDRKVEWLYEIIRITTTIESILEANPYYLLPVQMNSSKYFFGLQLGLAGLIKVYTTLIKNFDQLNHLKVLNNTLNSLKNQLENLDGNLTESLRGNLINNNRENGLAGILESLAYIKDLEGKERGKFSNDYELAVKTLPDPIITVPQSANFEFFIGFMIILLWGLKRIKSKTKLR